MRTLAAMKKGATDKMYGQVEEAELSCRILEAAQGMTRPVGLTAAQALEALDLESRAWLRQMALAALGYFMECLNASEKPS